MSNSLNEYFVEPRVMRMDAEFDQYLVDMKPHVLRLPHKTERQRCALWIKKLCEPVGSSTARKNRNMHAKMLLRMLQRGTLDGPFASSPEAGPLSTLPSYMSIFFDEPQEATRHHEMNRNQVSTPDWAKNELQESSTFLLGDKENEDFVSNTKPYVTSSPLQARNVHYKASEVPEHGYTGRYSPIQKLDFKDTLKGSTFRDEQSLVRMHEKELEMKTKVLEARFHEEKLKLQHKHDLAVQKILDRKNNEIEELKSHYKTKEKDYEESKRKMEKKAVQSAAKERQAMKDANDKEVDDLKSLIDETAENLRSEYEAKIHDMAGNMERDKYELQKTHTKNIQELLDDTNHRLGTMEEEYNTQTQATKLVVSELEGRVAQLTQETESLGSVKQSLLAEKQQVCNERDRMQAELRVSLERCEDLRKELQTQKRDAATASKSTISRLEASIEYLKQESSLTASKAQETIRDLEDQIQGLKHAVQDSEQQRQRELRERESLHQQDVMNMQHLHDKQVHGLKSEWDQDKSQANRTIKSLEVVIKEKDEQIVRMTVAQKQSGLQAEQAIESYKKQVNEAQEKVYNDMRGQLEKMGADLEQSKLTRDKLQDEFRKQIEELKERHNEELTETRVMYEHEKGILSQRSNSERDHIVREYEKQLSSSEVRLREALEEQEKIAEERRVQHQEVVSGLEQQIRDLREELVSANALRRQQLVELGLLREEERQKAARDNDMAVARLEAEIDRQRMEMHQQHAAELERQTQKAKSRLDQMEEDYRQQLDRAQDRISDAQRKENDARDRLVGMQKEVEDLIVQNSAKLEDEQNKIRAQMGAAIMNSQTELENEREKCHQIQREMQTLEYELKDQITRVKMQYEERMKGLLPKSLKDDLEETISCLKSQVKSLQQRTEILQDEVEAERVRSTMQSVDSLKL
uniref:Centrosomal protein of 112 kDa-like n=1 Tax=Phallusia mammillata TaxID=59560 RepID=A0A6F9D9K4_9ASCI|nr:centrosomal protein of 112 kDa-like [Phallusia mammillata]